MNSGLGHLEYEICSLLNITPKKLGQLRISEPDSINFFQMYLLNKWEIESKNAEKQKKEMERARAKAKARGRRRI